jgi:lipopolysaccharide/colanic/teichoic acid biosynthesis glycosyltransferase
MRRRTLRTNRFRLAKRGFDVAVAAFSLALLSPLFLVIGIAILVDSPGSILYRSTRVGRNGREFAVLKFRKMHSRASGGPLTVRNDARFTRIGGFLARSKLDELPQLWNVLRGDMSIVGPRPEASDFVALAPEYSVILRMRPGITGLSQLAFANESSILDPTRPVDDYVSRILPQKLHLDQLYVRSCSLRMDVRIIIWTFVGVVMRRSVSVDRRAGRLGLRKRASNLAVSQATAPASDRAAS